MFTLRGAEVKRLVFDVVSGTVTLVPAVTGKTIYIHGFFIDTIDNNTTSTLKSGAVSIGPDFFIASKGTYILFPIFESGWFASTLSGAVSLTVSGHVHGYLIYTQE